MWTAPIALILALPAVAQDADPSPIARCAAAARGNEIEICLQLAVAHPDQVEGIAAALKAHTAREGSPDQHLLLALLALIDDETAGDATLQIAALGDPRGVPALVACAKRRRLPVAEACIQSLAPFDAGLPHLAEWIRTDTQPLELQQVAARTLGDVGSDEAADVLVDALRRPRMNPALRKTVLETIESAYPDRAPETEGEVASDGRVWLTVGGGWGMSFAMGAAGYFGQSDLTALGWTTGAVGGATAGWLYGRAWPMESGDAAYITTGGILGTTSGMLVGSAVAPNSADGLYLGGLAGLAVGYAVPAITRVPHQGTGGDSVEASALASTVSIGAMSTAIFAQSQGRSERRWTTQTTPSGGIQVSNPSVSAPTLAAGLGLAGGAIAGHAVAPYVDLSAEDGGLLLLTTAWGTAAGGLVPIGTAERSTLPVITGAGGALLGYGLSHPFDVPADMQGAAWAGAGYGGAMGAGVGLLIDPDSAAPGAGALALGTAGMITGAALANLDPEPLDDRDIVLVGFATAWSAAQAGGWAGVVEPSPEAAGWFVIAPAAIGAATAIATPVLDVPVPQTAAATSLGLWGAYGAGVTAELTGGDPLAPVLIGSNVGLASGILVMSPVVGVPPVVIGVADAGGVLGGSVGALGASFLTQDGDAILVSSLIGAGAGFAGGAALGATWKQSGSRDMARLPGKIPGRWSVRPDIGVDRMGLAVDLREW